MAMHRLLSQATLLAGAAPLSPAAAARADGAEKLSGQERNEALTKLATQLHTEARSASDQPKAHQLASAIGDLAKATH